MAEAPNQLSAAALRIAGHVGQVALDRIAEGGVAAAAELEQHMAAVRAELTICQQPFAAGAEPGRRTTRRSRNLLRRLGGFNGSGHADRTGAGHTDDLQTRLALLRRAKVTCPDVPFVSDAFQFDATVPETLLLHYASGFVEAGIGSGWWPGKSADATDWASLHLAAICKLISQAEAAAEVHPDLRASA
jgi:Family of unknown function (DUF6401)